MDSSGLDATQNPALAQLSVSAMKVPFSFREHVRMRPRATYLKETSIICSFERTNRSQSENRMFD